MKHAKTLARGAKAALVAALGVWAVAGCQGIAGVEDVEFSETGPSTAACSAYCTEVMEGCPGDLRVYEDTETCKQVCKTFDTSDAIDGADTLACRHDQAERAGRTQGDKAAHCAAAAPGGGVTCTSEPELPDCEGYCSLYMAACKSISKDWGFKLESECIKECKALAPVGAYAVESAAVSGDTLGCRIHHASLAMLDPVEHCVSAGLFPAEACESNDAPNCEDYCRIVDAACTGSVQVYENRDQCIGVCKNTEPGDITDNFQQDTVGCRTYHSYNAITLGELPHCSHSGPAGNGVCSLEKDPNCTPYCRLAEAGCKELFDSRYDDIEECLEDCRTIAGAVPDPTTNGYNVKEAARGNTLQCRILHAARALEDPDDSENKENNCPSVFGGDDCK